MGKSASPIKYYYYKHPLNEIQGETGTGIVYVSNKDAMEMEVSRWKRRIKKANDRKSLEHAIYRYTPNGVSWGYVELGRGRWGTLDAINGKFEAVVELGSWMYKSKA